MRVAGAAAPARDEATNVRLVSAHYFETPLAAKLAQATARRRVTLATVAAFAGAALLMAAVGLYAVLAQLVSSRQREIGLRVALGAGRGAVLGLVLGRCGALLAAGLGLGLAGSLAAGRLVESLLFEVSATDPVTFAAVPVVLGLVGLLAAYLPARRALAVEPMRALASE